MKSSKLTRAFARVIMSEIRASYTIEELKAFKSFEAFWGEENVRQAYEEDWESEKDDWKPYYLAAFNVLRSI